MLTLMLSSVLAGSPDACSPDAMAPRPIDEVRVPGTRVSLQPPVGFEPSSEFAGFEDGAAQIRILEVRRPYEQFLAAHEDEAVVRLSRRPLAQPAALVPSVRAGELLERLAGDRDTLILREGLVVGLPSLGHHLHAISTGEDPVLHWRTLVWVVDGSVVELTARHPKDAELLRELEGAIRGISMRHERIAPR